MEAFVRLSGAAMPLMRINIDTDQITPGPFILRAYKEGWASALFGNWRYRPDGSLDDGFILNQQPWNKATILLADRNFGCGSSRESAPKALRAFGFRAVIAPSFGEIFYANCFRNGILPVELPIEQVQRLADQMLEDNTRLVTIDLKLNCVTAPGGEAFCFETAPYLRQMLLDGLDEVQFTLSHREAMDVFWTRDARARPWAYPASMSWSD